MGKHDLSTVSVNYDQFERELKERQHIINECPIDIYCSSISPRWAYPFKLMSYWEARSSVSESAESLIIDSGFKRYGDMTSILDEAQAHNAEWMVLPDITPHFHCYDEISPESRAKEYARHLVKYERKRQSSSTKWDGFDTGVLLPVHRPAEECLHELDNPAHTEKWSEFDDGESLLDRYGGVAIGLKGIPDQQRIEVLGRVDRVTPQDTHVHGLSPGTDMEMIAFLRENPHMVDSLDVSTPENAAKNNKIPDEDWKQHMVPFPAGTDVTTLRAMRALEIVLRLNHMLSSLCNDSEFADIARPWLTNADDDTDANTVSEATAVTTDD